MNRRPGSPFRIVAGAHSAGGFMRLFCALRATVLLVCAAVTPGYADGLRTSDSSGSGGTLQARVAACNCPDTAYRPSVRRHYRPRSYVRQYQEQEWVSAPVAPPEQYNPYLPSTFDTAYDRAMTLHFRSAAVTDTYLSERGWPPTPPIQGVFPYRVRAWGAVYQYDGLIGQYVALARPDAAQVVAVAVPIGP
jgi:hypothetical protein